MTPAEELLAIADRLDAAATPSALEASEGDLTKLEEVSAEAGRAFSGSWLGYHARVYYNNLQPPPPGAHFSQEWGLKEMSFASMGSHGDWREYDPAALIDHLRERAGKPSLVSVSAAADEADETLRDAKAEIQSVLLTENADGSDKYVAQLVADLDRFKPVTAAEAIQHWVPKGEKMTRDTVVVGQGNQVPPHIVIKAEVAAIRHSFGTCVGVAQIARKAASHLQRKARQRTQDARIGTNIFIGHGRSTAWRELKDFVQDRLHLPWDEFNRVPVAGVTNQARLAEMLDAAAIALVIMTAEDEVADGVMQARMNVIHEVGLFQGRLGFTKAIVLLENGCEEFSNIQGLGQIRFPSGNIAASFEEVRRVLERESVI
ncbi:MAG: TIR domain-containing protein [Pseudomonadota bacterium]